MTTYEMFVWLAVLGATVCILAGGVVGARMFFSWLDAQLPSGGRECGTGR